MQYICDVAGGRSWFRLETEAEAAQESAAMQHAVEKHFCRAREQAALSFDPTGIPYIEQDIVKASHIRRTMPAFFSLRDAEGQHLVTAMLPPPGGDPGFRCIVVGPGNADPYPDHADAIAELGQRFGLTLDRASCYPYRR